MRSTIIVAALLAALPAAAQEMDHQSHGAPATGTESLKGAKPSPTPPSAEATREMAAINARMHKAMNVPMTGDLDADFVRGMIPHHEGAIEMAELQLRYSKDPQIRTLARGIIAAQRREITFMRAWLRERGIPEK